MRLLRTEFSAVRTAGKAKSLFSGDSNLKTRISFLYTASALCGAVIEIDCVSVFCRFSITQLHIRRSGKLENRKIADSKHVVTWLLSLLNEPPKLDFPLRFWTPENWENGIELCGK